MKKLLLALLLLLPFQASAATTHNYVCTDWLLAGGMTCSGGTLSMSGQGGRTANDYNAGAVDFNLYGTATWYVSFVVTRTAGDNIRLRCYDGTDFCPSVSVSATIVDEPIDMTGRSDPAGLAISNDIGPVLYYEGDISNICVSDTLGACAGGGAAPFRAFIATILWFL